MARCVPHAHPVNYCRSRRFDKNVATVPRVPESGNSTTHGRPAGPNRRALEPRHESNSTSCVAKGGCHSSQSSTRALIARVGALAGILAASSSRPHVVSDDHRVIHKRPSGGRSRFKALCKWFS